MKKHASFETARHIAARHARASGRPAEFRAEVSGERGALHVYEVIGESWDGGITAKKVQEALASMKGVKALDVFINSPGGDIFEGKAIFAQLERFDGEIVVHVDGIAASAASFVAMAGDRIITAPYATWMIHEPWTVAIGRAVDLRATADVLDIEIKTYAETYAKRTGQTVEDVLGWMAAETWMNAATAKERGFTDEIAETEDSEEEGLEAAITEALTNLRALAG